METLNIKNKIPNIITMIRIILIIPIIILLLVPTIDISYSYVIDSQTYQITWNQVIAAIIFIIASLSDFLDGYLSRKWKCVSNFGKFWDPLADKILVNITFILLAYKDFTCIVFVIIFIIRDVIIDGLRFVNAKNNIVISARWSGKLKTVLQMFSILVLLFLGTNIKNVIWWYWAILNLLVYLSMLMSIYSLIEYSLKFFKQKKLYL